MPLVAVTVEQLWRPQPGGIATYVRGLLRGLSELESSWQVVGLAPRAPGDGGVAVALRRAPFSGRVLTRLWAKWPVGVPAHLDALHATTLAGPFRGAARNSVALHDVLWRDEPGTSTKAGISFHERRLRHVLAHDELTLIVTSPPLATRLIAEGVASERVYCARMGVDDGVTPAPTAATDALLYAHGVQGPFTLYAGTREPRKNLARLLAAHRAARAVRPELGPLVVVGPEGWGEATSSGAVILGPQSRAQLKGLLERASVFAYVPLNEGWGLPAVEALALGTRVVVSTTTPSTWDNDTVSAVDPLDEARIAEGLVAALDEGDNQVAAQRRRESVRALSWRACAETHLAAWS